VVRSRAPRLLDSIRCSMPVIQAGRSAISLARSSAASTTAAAPSEIGAQSCARNGSARYGSASNASTPAAPRTCACGLVTASVRHRAATAAMSRSLHSPASSPSLACNPAIPTESGHSGATVYGSSCSASTRRRFPAEDLPNPYTSAVSTSPVRIFTHASYSAHAPSISTCDSLIGGNAPIASTADTNENARPAR
jgi:hypothetical protein